MRTSIITLRESVQIEIRSRGVIERLTVLFEQAHTKGPAGIDRPTYVDGGIRFDFLPVVAALKTPRSWSL